MRAIKIGTVTILSIGVAIWLFVCNCRCLTDPDVSRQIQELVLLKGLGASVALHALRIDDPELKAYRVTGARAPLWNMESLSMAHPIRSYFVRNGEPQSDGLAVWLCYAYKDASMNEASPIHFSGEKSLPFVFLFHHESEHKGVLLDAICATGATPLRINRVVRHHENVLDGGGVYGPSGRLITNSMYLSEQDSTWSIFVEKWPYSHVSVPWPAPAQYFIQRTHLRLRTIEKGLRIEIGVEGPGIPPEVGYDHRIWLD